MPRIVILGNGIAGITAARHIRKYSDFKITVISGETDYFFSRTALMYVYMGHMKFEHTQPYEDSFWDKNNIELVKDWILSIDFERKKMTGENGSYEFDQLILALGSKPNMFGWKGQELLGVQGLYSFQDLQKMETSTQNIKQAVIVGGGLIGIEMAEMLLSRNISVTHLVREKHFWDIVLPKEEAQLIDQHIISHGIDLRLETELEEIVADENGRVSAVKTKTGDLIPTQFVGLTVGVSPNVSILKNSDLKIEKGILVDKYLKTNIPDIYAIGDCAQLVNPPVDRKPIEAVWYTGRIMGETVAQTITGTLTAYKPGIWFNSAKFFDIEYQTYGIVSTVETSTEKHFFWKSHAAKQSLRISFNPASQAVLGVITLGMRMRHEIWDQWIHESKKLPEVISQLANANFDPEFFKSYVGEIQRSFNASFPENTVRIKNPSFIQRIMNP